MLENQSKILFERSKCVVPGGVHSPVRSFRGVGGVPLFMQSADGAFIEDVSGKSYLDFCLSWGPLLLGHRDPFVHEAVSKALERGWSFGTAEPYSLMLAEFITNKIPWVKKIRFVNSGTEAVMAALRLARAATGRRKLLKFGGCYHGHVDSMLVQAGSGLADMAEPSSAGISRELASETLVLKLDDDVGLERLLGEEGHEIAAVIIEPLPANNGLLLQRPEFLQKVADLTRKAGALLIFDEVISGFRVAWGGMAELTGIEPDLVTYGKIIGGGFPVGAYGGRSELMDWIAPLGPVYQAGTLSANPLAMVAGLKTLEKIKDLNPYLVLEERTQALAKSLQAFADKQAVALRLVTKGSLFWPVFMPEQTVGSLVIRSPEQIPKRHSALYARFFHSLLRQGVYLPPSAFEVSFLSTRHLEPQIELFLKAAEIALGEVSIQSGSTS